MQGITVVIVAFIFACIVWPSLVKNTSQFYGVIGLAMAIILLDAIGRLVGGGLATLAYVFNSIFQVASILLLVMSTGGQSLGDIKKEMTKTIELVRRGGEEESIIVPLRGEKPKERSR